MSLRLFERTPFLAVETELMEQTLHDLNESHPVA